MKWKDKHTAATSVSHRETFYKVINSVYKWKSETYGHSYIDSCHKTS